MNTVDGVRDVVLGARLRRHCSSRCRTSRRCAASRGLPGTALVHVRSRSGTTARPSSPSPRQILRGQLERLARARLAGRCVGSELEFIAVRRDLRVERRAKRYREPASPRTPTTSTTRSSARDGSSRCCAQIRLGMAGAGHAGGGLEGRVQLRPARGQLPLPGGAAGWRTTTPFYRNGAKEIVVPERQGAHVHAQVRRARGQFVPHPPSLWNDSGSLFPAADGHGMSETFSQFIAGLVRHTRELTLLLAPNVNSYKRFVRGSFAPTALVWGHDNRTCALRVVGHGQGMRVESRVEAATSIRIWPSPRCSPRASRASTGSTSGPAWTAGLRGARTSRTCPRRCTRGARAVRGLGAGARGARRRGRRSLPECRHRRAGRLRRRRHRLGAASLLRAPQVSRPRIGHLRLPHARALDALGVRGDALIPQGYVEGVRLGGRACPSCCRRRPEGAEGPR